MSGRPITGNPVRSYSFGLRKSQVDFIEAVGVGSNLGEKLRSIIDRSADIIGNIAHTPGATLLYYAKDGEKCWVEAPFQLVKKDWKLVPEAARKAGWICQVIENLGDIEVWVAPGKTLSNCKACRERVLNVLHD